ncbi:hypothetical protein Tco_0732543 [Tanacetum coccineum]
MDEHLPSDCFEIVYEHLLLLDARSEFLHWDQIPKFAYLQNCWSKTSKDRFLVQPSTSTCKVYMFKGSQESRTNPGFSKRWWCGGGVDDVGGCGDDGVGWRVVSSAGNGCGGDGDEGGGVMEMLWMVDRSGQNLAESYGTAPEKLMRGGEDFCGARQEGNALFGFQDLCLRQELLEYMGVHDNDASESLQPSWGKMCTSGT